MKSDIKETIEKFAVEVESLVGRVEMRINHSETNFGQSSYLYVGPFKIRYSDHSTGVFRSIEEMNLSSITKQSILDTIERYYFPERFEEVNTLEFGDEHEATQKKIDGLTYEYEILKENVRVSKKGQPLSLIRVRNVAVKSFKRV